MEKPEVLNLVIEFGGGAEFLFGNVKNHKVQLVQENSSKWTIRKLLQWMEKNLLKERPELFIQENSVRPGILVLINDADWELMVILELPAGEMHKLSMQMQNIANAVLLNKKFKI